MADLVLLFISRKAGNMEYTSKRAIVIMVAVGAFVAEIVGVFGIEFTFWPIPSRLTQLIATLIMMALGLGILHCARHILGKIKN